MKWRELTLSVAVLAACLSVATGCGQPASQQGTATPSTVAPDGGGGPGGTRPTAPPSGAFRDNMTLPSIDWAAAAAKLGVPEQQLRDAIGDLGQAPPDFAAAAKKLGVAEDALRQALGFPAGTPFPKGMPPSGVPPSGAPPTGPPPTGTKQ